MSPLTNSPGNPSGSVRGGYLDTTNSGVILFGMGINKTTPYGALVRERRVKAGLSLRDVAGHLEVSHVFLADVERGVSGALREEYDSQLLEILPNVTAAELQRARIASKPVKITPPNERYHELASVFARRVERQNLSEAKFAEILKLLNEESDD